VFLVHGLDGPQVAEKKALVRVVRVVRVFSSLFRREMHARDPG
jgi:hypothetical protein